MKVNPYFSIEFHSDFSFFSQLQLKAAFIIFSDSNPATTQR
jgi:hypothetical protein